MQSVVAVCCLPYLLHVVTLFRAASPTWRALLSSPQRKHGRRGGLSLAQARRRAAGARLYPSAKATWRDAIRVHAPAAAAWPGPPRLPAQFGSEPSVVAAVQSCAELKEQPITRTVLPPTYCKLNHWRLQVPAASRRALLQTPSNPDILEPRRGEDSSQSHYPSRPHRVLSHRLCPFAGSSRGLTESQSQDQPADFFLSC